jgi:segregation and condensation protein A
MNHDLNLGYQQDNLPKSGQALLWDSMLVRFKSDTLEKLDSTQDQEEYKLNFRKITQNFSNRSLTFYLEQKLRCCTAASPPSQRRITLSELITHMEEIAEELACTQPNSIQQGKQPSNASRQKLHKL